MANTIAKITEAMLLEIKKKSVLYLPDNPSASGMSATSLKQAFAGLVTDSTKSLKAELDRVVDEINVIFGQLFTDVLTTLPEITGYEEGDTILLTDGAIYTLTDGAWVKSSISKSDFDLLYAKVHTNLEDRVAELETVDIPDLQGQIDDLEDGTSISKRAEQDKNGAVIDLTYLAKSNGSDPQTVYPMITFRSGLSAYSNKIVSVADGTNANDVVNKSQLDTKLDLVGGTMSGSIEMGTNKITGLGDGVDNQDGATMKNIDTKITAHDESETAHLYIRELIQDVESELARIEGRGKSYGELALKQSELLALEESARNTAIYNDILARHTSYELANGQLVYTLEDDEENTHEWEYNSTEETWVDNGAYTTEKASNTNYGLIKGDSTYLSIVSGLVQVLKSDYADKIGTSLTSYTYEQLLSAFNDRYTKAEVDAIIDSLKTAFGWEETDLGTYSTPIDLSDYDLVIADLSETTYGLHNTEIFNPSDYSEGDKIVLSLIEPSDDIVVGNGLLEKGTTTWSYGDVSGTNILKLRGYKIAPIQAENVVYDNSTSGLTADSVQEAIDEIDGVIDEIDLAVEQKTDKLESRQVGETTIQRNLDGLVIKVTNPTVILTPLYVNGKLVNLNETYSDGKSYITTFNRLSDGTLVSINKQEVL